MTTDDLDSKSDRELDELFAREVAELRGLQLTGNTLTYIRSASVEDQLPVPIPAYTTDANAVLPWLEKHRSFSMDRTHLADDGEEYRVALRSVASEPGLAKTFPRAAVLALLRAKRNEKSA